jgi:hypothetical protein
MVYGQVYSEHSRFWEVKNMGTELNTIQEVALEFDQIHPIVFNFDQIWGHFLALSPLIGLGKVDETRPLFVQRLRDLYRQPRK